jgi:hypothetical protein|tara:strand:+ start:699 stop:884 length:186 start_codon:yes stop_codon:yes gene_type:complete
MHTLGFHIFGHEGNADSPGPWALGLSHLPIANLLWTLSNDSWGGNEEEKEKETVTTHDHPI